MGSGESPAANAKMGFSLGLDRFEFNSKIEPINQEVRLSKRLTEAFSKRWL